MSQHARAGSASLLRLASICSVQLVLLAVCALAQNPAPHPQPGPNPVQQQPGNSSLIGTVTGAHGEVLQGAVATLTDTATGAKRTRISDSNGFLSFSVPAGKYILIVSSPGFASWSSGTLALAPGDYRELPGIVLTMNTATDTVRVTASERELATRQVHIEEKQRIFGAIPNFYVTYAKHPAPLSAGQKFQLAWKNSLDPFNFAAAGAQAGFEQAGDEYAGYGSGAAGFAKRYAAAYADAFNSSMIGGALFASMLRQDPRYYYLGHGRRMFRTMYALGSVVICKGDNGRWQPNYSFVLGSFASGATSSLYYPSSSGSAAQITLDNGVTALALGEVNALAEEFVLRRLTRGAPKTK
jgi:hypothetical protein